MYELVLKNGFLVSSKEVRRGDIVVSGGKIVDIVDRFEGEAEFVHDISGKYVLPGLIDAHVHFREPGSEEKENFETGSMAAVAGGVTTVFDMPNTEPKCTTADILEEKRKRVKGRSFCHYGFYFGVTDDNFSEMKKVKNIAGFKYFMTHSTGNMGVVEKNGKNGGCVGIGRHGEVTDLSVLELVFDSVSNIVAVHAEDDLIIQENASKYFGDIEPISHGAIRSRLAAYKAVKDVLHLAKKYNHRVHICHVSCREELREILKFKTDKVTFEVTPHHLFLTEEAYEKHRNYVKVNPPLRQEEDKDELWKALKAGHVDIIATDHAPHLPFEKEREYLEVPSGVPGIETMLPLLLDAVNHGQIDLEDVVRMTSYNPSRIFGVKGKGELSVGKDADFVVVDMKAEKEVRNENLYTKCGWSPFHGLKLKGWPFMTFISGKPVYKDGKVDKNFRSGKEVTFLK
ncbi:dihydroorotase family protein [Candidatus Peregrinibacteria bacterium]|nr:dihydroorotase family protein [Candidatus Peregrinibacteria bacterium]